MCYAKTVLQHYRDKVGEQPLHNANGIRGSVAGITIGDHEPLQRDISHKNAAAARKRTNRQPRIPLPSGHVAYSYSSVSSARGGV